MRLGLDWHVNETITLISGYGWIKSFPYGKQPIAATFQAGLLVLFISKSGPSKHL